MQPHARSCICLRPNVAGRSARRALGSAWLEHMALPTCHRLLGARVGRGPTTALGSAQRLAAGATSDERLSVTLVQRRLSVLLGPTSVVPLPRPSEGAGRGPRAWLRRLCVSAKLAWSCQASSWALLSRLLARRPACWRRAGLVLSKMQSGAGPATRLLDCARAGTGFAPRRPPTDRLTELDAPVVGARAVGPRLAGSALTLWSQLLACPTLLGGPRVKERAIEKPQ